MTALDDLARRVADLELRMGAVQNGPPPVGPTYGPNVISNGGMESGITGWVLNFFFGASGATPTAETAAPLDGLRSLKAPEAAASSSRFAWCPGGSFVSPTVGSDVFATSPGDQWLVTAAMQSTIVTAHAKIFAVGGALPSDCYGGGGTTFIAAADLPLAAAQPTILSGQITVPAGMNYLTFIASADDGATSAGGAWSWLMDDVTLQQRTS